jgi:hypothetical protein
VRLQGRRTLLVVGAAAVVASSVLGVGIAEAVGGTGHPAARYGGLPSFLPASSLRPDSTLTGTVARPALTSEGDAVRARLAHGSVLITVSGPVVPGEGLPYQATADTATWTVTMSHATGVVPVSAKAFSTVDLLGKTYRPALVSGQPQPPAMVRPGHQVSFELRVVMPVGEGMMRWAPVRRGLLATWDFVVEND